MLGVVKKIALSLGLSSEMPPLGSHRMRHVDVLRAFAALSVVYAHSFSRLVSYALPFEVPIQTFLHYSLDPGKTGVILFFMVSGFVIPFSLKPNTPRRPECSRFLINRAFRLYPAYWLSILASFLFLFHASLSKCSLARIIGNITMFQGFIGINDMEGVYWTLQIEWMFYIVCLFLFARKKLHSPRAVLHTVWLLLGLALVLAFVRYHTHHALPVAAFLGMSVMFTSTLWRMYKVDALPGSRSAFRASLTSTLIALVPICLLAYSFETVFAENWHRYLLCYYLSIALFLAGTSILKITSPLLALIGEASYGIYLFSAFINMGFERLVPLSISRVISLQGYVLIEIIMSCLVCIFVHYTFEKPMIRVGRSVAERLVGKRKQTVMSSHASGC